MVNCLKDSAVASDSCRHRVTASAPTPREPPLIFASKQSSSLRYSSSSRGSDKGPGGDSGVFGIGGSHPWRTLLDPRGTRGDEGSSRVAS